MPNESRLDNHAGFVLLFCNKRESVVRKVEASMLVLIDQIG